MSDTDPSTIRRDVCDTTKARPGNLSRVGQYEAEEGQRTGKGKMYMLDIYQR
jgi:hypothetical protein